MDFWGILNCEKFGENHKRRCFYMTAIFILSGSRSVMTFTPQQSMKAERATAIDTII